MKSSEKVVMAAVQKHGMSLRYASEDMKNNEKVVMAAVHNDGSSLRLASKDMKNNEKVVMAAVQNDGSSLRYASEDMKNNAKVVMDAVQHDGSNLQYASEEMKTKVTVVQLFAKQVGDDGYGERGIAVTCTNLGGNVVANVILEPDCNSQDLQQSISLSLGVPPPGLRLILPSGEQLRDHKQKPLRDLFMLELSMPQLGCISP